MFNPASVPSRSYPDEETTKTSIEEYKRQNSELKQKVQQLEQQLKISGEETHQLEQQLATSEEENNTLQRKVKSYLTLSMLFLL